MPLADAPLCRRSVLTGIVDAAAVNRTVVDMKTDWKTIFPET
jgi:hypothetical protein